MKFITDFGRAIQFESEQTGEKIAIPRHAVWECNERGKPEVIEVSGDLGPLLNRHGMDLKVYCPFDPISALDMNMMDWLRKKQDERHEWDWGVSVRLANAIQKNFSDLTLREFVQMSDRKFLATRNIGRKSFWELRHLLEEDGLHLGMKEISDE